MKLISKYSGVLLAAAWFTTTTLPAQDKPASTTPATNTPKLEDLLPDPVVIKGTGFEIKRSRLDEAVASLRASVSASGRELTAADLPMLEKYACDRLLQIELYKQKATEDDKAKGKADANKEVDTILKRAPSEEKVIAQLKLQGLTLDTFRARLTEEAVAKQVLRDKVTVTDADVKKYYDDNPDKFEQPDMVRASHILISTLDKSGAPLSEDDTKAKRKIIDDLLKRARAGEDFAKLAKEYSDDPGSKDKGGEYTFPRGQMVKEFEAAAFSLHTNQISDVVTTKFGFHIIKLSEKIPAKKLELNKEITEYVKNGLEEQAMAKILPDDMARLKKEANVQILDDQLKSMLDAADEAIKKLPKPPTAPN